MAYGYFVRKWDGTACRRLWGLGSLCSNNRDLRAGFRIVPAWAEPPNSSVHAYCDLTPRWASGSPGWSVDQWWRVRDRAFLARVLQVIDCAGEHEANLIQHPQQYRVTWGNLHRQCSAPGNSESAANLR